MVPKFAKAGTSFKGVMQYLTHDAGHAATSHRVAWTHTINLAHDHVPSAINEMYMTAENAELLKADSGAGKGSVVKQPVRHVSLNWSPDEKPGRAEMIRAVESFMTVMGIEDHQAFVVCHTDRPHPHVHVIYSAIHPETGKKYDDSFEFRRAERWALAYEKEQGKILCSNRLVPWSEREPSMPRPIWKLLEAGLDAHMRAETARMVDAPNAHGLRVHAETVEWKALREIQKEERLAFFAEGKPAYRALRQQVYRDVRREFTSQWRLFYSAKKSGVDPEALIAMKADLIERQRLAVEAARDQACAALRLERDAQYRQLLDAQKDERRELQSRQERGVPAVDLLYQRAIGRSSPDKAHLTASAQPLAPNVRDGVRDFHWTGKAGMAAQQRSAFRFLQHAARRAAAQPEGKDGNRRTLDRLYDRKVPAAHERGPPDKDRGAGIEPD